MKKKAAAIAIAVAVVGIVAWLTLNLAAKSKYDQARSQLMSQLPSYSVAQMDDDTMALLAEARENWVERVNEVGGPHSDALKTVRLQPSVAGLVCLFTYRQPEFSFLSPSRNSEASAIGLVQSVILPVTIDGAIHVSEDGHLALVRCSRDVIYVFSDEPTSLREAMYHRKAATTKPGAEGDAASRRS